MTWLAEPITMRNMTRDVPWLLGGGACFGAVERASSRLGSAHASRDWRWAAETPARASAARKRQPAAAVLRVPPALLQAMSAVAHSEGISESEIWSAAARAWLERRTRDDEPQPPTPAGAALPIPLRTRSWAAIDTLLRDLRRPKAPAA
ncbi:MAG TPA: hypothetical protein VKC57_00915 [Ktedonobacterales bacterium]|nr:hypothetical protein [Ktedonobacterales bacterium]